MAKKILGLDLGTNSIGWALIKSDFEKKEGEILGMGSRIIPMSQDKLNDFGKGNSVSQTAERTGYRGTRHLHERYLLRRERLHRVLNILGFLPEHYSSHIDFKIRLGQFLEDAEPKIACKPVPNEAKNKTEFEFIFKKAFEEMLEDFRKHQPGLFNRKNKKGEDAKIPYDWTIYYLRKKALTKALNKEELAWLLLNFNQKRGYYQLRGEEEEETRNKLVEFHSLKVIDVKADIKYSLRLENNEVYYRSSDTPLFDWKDTNREFILTTYLEKDGTVKKDKDGKEKRSFYLKEDLALLKRKATKNTKSSQKRTETTEEKTLKIIDVKEEKQDEIWYSLTLENGWIYRRASKVSLMDWKDKVRDFIVTTDLNDDETIKKDEEGKESRSFRAPKEDDWTLIKKKTEDDLDKYIKEFKRKNGIDGTVGTYIYDTLLQKPNQKIKGKLVRTIERRFYKEELTSILKKQIELQPELFNDDFYSDCVRELYRNNEAHQLSLSKRDFVHLFVEDILFYQRPLKSKKSSIGNCALEYRTYKVKDKDGKEEIKKEYLKAIPKSHPLYQEFRVWQWLFNLKIYRKEDDKEVTADFIKSNEDLENLFAFLMTLKEVNHIDILNYFIAPKTKEKYPSAKASELKKEITKEIAQYRWNYVFDDSKEKEEEKSKYYPCNETGYEIRRRLEKVADVPAGFLEKIDLNEITTKNGKKETISLGTRECQLWFIIYSVTDKVDFEKALKSFAQKNKLDETSFLENFKKFPPFKSEYGSYSEKAIKKLLPLMRLGNNYWKWEAMDTKIKERISKIITGEYDEKIKNRVREKAIHLTEQNHFQGLQLWLAQYIVYDRHSEAENSDRWKMSYDIYKYLEDFKQYSLRNPIVEQIVTETLRVVKDIWDDYGEKNNVSCVNVYDEKKKKNVKNYEKFFDEIHIELGREMKNTKEDRLTITNQISQNENTNLRIKALLAELNENSDGSLYVENVRPYSPMQQDALKIFESDIINSDKRYNPETKEFDNDPVPDEILKISKTAQPNKSELQRYKLWLEQRYRSPYTGQIIPLGKLFTEEYQIEHVIPISRFWDDSYSNKVICEAAVNQLKDNQLGMEFIKNHHGEKVETGFGKTVEIFSETAYKDFIKQHYDKNRGKRNKLLLEEIPDKMIDRQLNDTRYISKFISNLLSNIVRAEKDDEGVNSNNLIPCNGKITSELRKDWGLDDVWNDLILPRFERLNKLKNSNDFTAWNEKHQKFLPAVPLKDSKGFQKKRIDHRHHALDALVIACATRDHVQYLNNENAKSQKFHLQRGLAKKLRKFEPVEISKMKKNDKGVWVKSDEKIKKEVPKDFLKPWDTITQEVRSKLEEIVVSFKQNIRVINKATNYYQSYKDEKGNLRIGKDGKAKKDFVKQTKGDNWSVRKSLHTPMPYGKKHYYFEVLKIAENFGKIENIIDGLLKEKATSILAQYKNISEANKETKAKSKEYLLLYNKYQEITDKIGALKLDKEPDAGKLAEIETDKSKMEDKLKSFNKFLLIDENLNLIEQVPFRLSNDKFRRRQPISELANRGQGGIKTVDDAVKFIDKVADYNIRKDLLKHLKESNHDLETAFSSAGLEKFNSNRKIPVYKLPIAESGSSRFAVGNKITTKHKWVESDKGTNLFYAVYIDKETGNRLFDAIPLNEVIEFQKQQHSETNGIKKNDVLIKSAIEVKGKAVALKFEFTLTPGDLVYMPNEEEKNNKTKIDFNNLSKEQIKRVFVVNDFSGGTCYFTPNHIAKNIVPKEVDLSYDGAKNKLSGSYDTKTASFEGKQIKDYCIKLTVDRLGNISSYNSSRNEPHKGSKQASILMEPSPAYNNRIQITTLQSLEEQTREHTRNMTYDQRMEYLQQLRRTMHSEEDINEFVKKFWENRIEINKTE